VNEAIKMSSRIELWPLEKLKPYARNPRTHTPEQVAKVAASIVEFGFTNPILVDANQGIIAGHCRLMAAQKLGLTTVPIIELTHLSEAQKRAYVIADNRLALDAGWDMELLAREMAALKDEGFDVELTGFSGDEIDELLDSGEAGGLTDDDEAPPMPEEAITVPGDVWTLGRHRLLCGDATVLSDIEKLMKGDMADCTWTDPPYNVNYGEKAEMLDKYQKGHRNTSRILNDNMDSKSFYEFLHTAFTNVYAVSKAGAAIYVAHAETEGVNFRTALKEAGVYLSSCLIWRKNALVLGRSDYHWQHEPVLYGWKDTGAHRWFGGRDKTTIQEFEGAPFQQIGDNEWQIPLGETTLIVRGDNLTVEAAHGTVFFEEKPRSSPEHPTMKPVALIERMVCNSTKKADIVIDPFGGSGSTLIACEKTGRSARLLELDPKYCDVIVRRWQDYTGKMATLECDGRTFAEVEKKRGGEFGDGVS